MIDGTNEYTLVIKSTPEQGRQWDAVKTRRKHSLVFSRRS
jgi:hypothetical protein